MSTAKQSNQKKPAKTATKNVAPNRSIGRPSSFTQRLAETICIRLACGESLRKICADEGMPDKTSVLRWLYTNEEFRTQYARARELQQEFMAEEILEIADDGTNDTYVDADGNVRVDHDVIARSRLRVDTRKWLMSKLAPKKYGERVDVNHGGQAENPLAKLLKEVQGTYIKPVAEPPDDEDD
ncbi:terminase small subunit-like protein [Cupriavidus oxalaticus]|uniref:terminase small subunit-like protein n=1 Tax=Cupriavidus oxalaticus TaxID=96344 RepID=UPI004034E3C8